MTKKHGIIRKKYQSKMIFNQGYRLVNYDYQPLSIEFKNEMVNDMNQHFCGGWSLTDVDLSNEALLERVLQGNKPMAVISAWKKEDLEFITGRVDDTKYYSASGQYELTGAFYTIVAVKGKLKDLFDLPLLFRTYKENDIHIDIEEHENKTLKDFFSDWDAQDADSEIDTWVTGLILGYPIENTISIYRNGVWS